MNKVEEFKNICNKPEDEREVSELDDFFENLSEQTNKEADLLLDAIILELKNLTDEELGAKIVYCLASSAAEFNMDRIQDFLFAAKKNKSLRNHVNNDDLNDAVIVLCEYSFDTWITFREKYNLSLVRLEEDLERMALLEYPDEDSLVAFFQKCLDLDEDIESAFKRFAKECKNKEFIEEARSILESVVEEYEPE